eukprot:scaffold133232_cov63-Phaeocystis_antarctica.AAC.2
MRCASAVRALCMRCAYAVRACIRSCRRRSLGATAPVGSSTWSWPPSFACWGTAPPYHPSPSPNPNLHPNPIRNSNPSPSPSPNPNPRAHTQAYP